MNRTASAPASFARPFAVVCVLGLFASGPGAFGQIAQIAQFTQKTLLAEAELPSAEQPATIEFTADSVGSNAVAPAVEAESDIAATPAEKQATPSTITSDPISKRLFGIIPNYRADQTLSTYQPLTVSEKFNIARNDSFDWPNYFMLAGFALESQVAAGGFSHNGGMTGFGEAYGRALGDQIIGSYVTEAILPSVLHEDPRYFRLGSGTIRHRAMYAASRIFVTRKDDGHNGFNISEIAGNAGFVALATLYYTDMRSASEGIERYGLQLGNDVVTNLLTEFWPDIKHRLRFPRRRWLVFP